MKKRLTILFYLLVFVPACSLHAEDGYRLWLRYNRVSDPIQLKEYRSSLENIIVEGTSATMFAIRKELRKGLGGLLDREIEFADKPLAGSLLIVGTPNSSAMIKSLDLNDRLKQVGKEGYIILTTTLRENSAIIITANTDVGLLYGTFAFLQRIQTGKNIVG